MKIIFAGTPDFAVPALLAILKNHQVDAVLTQPDRKAGRGKILQASPIKVCALANKLLVLQPANLGSIKTQQQLKTINADLIVVVAYGVILPATILALPKYGCINIHASLLPRWRGAAPIQRAILAGDKQTGICIMLMEAGLDTGDVLYGVTTEISNDETSSQLHARLAIIGAEAVVTVLADITKFQASKIRQRQDNISYAKKIFKDEANIDWQQSGVQIHRKIRAFNAYPVAQTSLHGKTIRIWLADIENGGTKYLPGSIIKLTAEYLAVATKDGIIKITQLQFPGKKKMLVRDFYNSNHKLKLDRFT